MQLTPRDMIVIFSGLLGLVLAGYLFLHPGPNRRAGRLLAAFLSLQGTLLVVSVLLFRHLLYLGWEQGFRALFYLESLALLLDGILLYAYCSALLFQRSFRPSGIVLQLSAGLALWSLCLWIYSHADVMSYFDPADPERSTATGVAYTTLQAARALYGLLCLRLLAEYRVGILDQRSDPGRRDVSWLFILIRGIVGYRLGWLLLHLGFTLAAAYSWNLLDHKWIVGGAMLSLDLGWLALSVGLIYFGLRHGPRFSSLDPIGDDPRPETAPGAAAMPRAALSVGIDSIDAGGASSGSARPQRDDDLRRKLDALMTNRRLYRDPELRLDQVAGAMGCSPKAVSGLINGHHRTNFCDFINGHRIAEAKRLLLEAEGKSVLDICLEVGFNSKSAFNRSFKKATGQTPLSYRKRALTSEVSAETEKQRSSTVHTPEN